MTKNVPIPESVRRIIALNSQYNFKKEYIDSGGMGISVCDLLRENSENKRKVVEINNASRPIDHTGSIACVAEHISGQQCAAIGAMFDGLIVEI